MLSKNQIKLIKSLESKKFRKREGLFVAEGPKVVGDLLRAGYQPHAIFSTEPRPDAELITDDELHRISFLQHPQEILAVFHIPTPQKSSNLHLPSDLTPSIRHLPCPRWCSGSRQRRHHHPYSRLVWHYPHLLFTRYCRRL